MQLVGASLALLSLSMTAAADTNIEQTMHNNKVTLIVLPTESLSATSEPPFDVSFYHKMIDQGRKQVSK